MKEFFTTLQGKAIAVLTIIALLFGIGAEGTSMYRNAMEGVTSQAIARESAARQEAERREKQALAEKTAAEQRTAEAVANESRLRQEAERREKQALAEKTAAEQRTAEAVAAVSREMQAATVAAKEAEARKLDGEATQAQMIACAMNTSKCTPEQLRIIAGDQGVGSRIFDLNTAAQQRLAGTSLSTRPEPQDEAPANPSQLSPKCRQYFANWKAANTHGAFAITNDEHCFFYGDNAYPYSTDKAVTDLKNYCNQKDSACTIIATK